MAITSETAGETVTATLKLKWRAPRWSYVRRLWLPLRDIFNSASLWRITLATVVVSAAIVAGFKWAVPQLVLTDLWRIVFAPPALALMLVAQLGILTLVRPIVTVRADKIFMQHGQSATIIDTSSVKATRLTFHRDDRIRLRICYTRKSKMETLVVGVPPTVDFDCLSELLPVFPVIRDARNFSLTKQTAQHRLSE